MVIKELNEVLGIKPSLTYLLIKDGKVVSLELTKHKSVEELKSKIVKMVKRKKYRVAKVSLTYPVVTLEIRDKLEELLFDKLSQVSYSKYKDTYTCQVTCGGLDGVRFFTSKPQPTRTEALASMIVKLINSGIIN